MLSDSIRYNRVYARIDIGILRQNIKTLRSVVKPSMKVLSVIKADAYGHGAVEIAKRIGDLSDYYGVASIDEAIELRNAGIDMPILIIGYTADDDFERALLYDITLTMHDVDDCKKLAHIAIANDKIAKIHLKIDTGMSRLGFPSNSESLEQILELKHLKGIFIEGIFTHYAKADEADKTFAIMQKNRFFDFINKLKNEGIDPPIKHIDNSAGTMDLDDDEFDMVRIGISMYGLYPSDDVKKSCSIKPVMSMFAHIACVRTISKGTPVGYGATYVAKDDTKVATVTIGYADGYPRAQSNLGRVIIGGEYAPIVGRVCMDQLMVDVTHIPDVKAKDEVIIIGEDNGKIISVEEIAEPANSFNYELVCNVGRRVPRMYCEGDMCVAHVNYLIN